MIRGIIKEEIRFEKTLLEKIQNSSMMKTDVVLIFSKGIFCYRPKGRSRKFHYIKRSDCTLLRSIVGGRFLAKKEKILLNNIGVLEKMLPKLQDYDDESVINSLPKAHIAAIEKLRDGAGNDEVIQSEDPKHREKLTIKASDGLMVRTKGELNLYETLKSYGLNVRYEKAITLTERILLSDGTVITQEKTIYPDFTIILPDGNEIYWEIMGMYDLPNYRDEQIYKINLYYDNGIYMPKNLIITMECKDKPLDLMAIRRIIEGTILPLVK